MHPATYFAFEDELEKIANFIPGVTIARPVLKQMHPGAHGFETLAKGVGGTTVARGARAVGNAAQKVVPWKSIGKKIGLGAGAVGAGAEAEHLHHKKKEKANAPGNNAVV